MLPGLAPIPIDGLSLNLERFAAVVLDRRPALLDQGARGRVRAARETIEEAVASGAAVYGVNTGFGNLANVGIAPRDLETRVRGALFLSDAADALQRQREEILALIDDVLALVGEPIEPKPVF